MGGNVRNVPTDNQSIQSHYENTPIQIRDIENFTTKTESFQIKKSDFFFYISAQNMDCVYSLEPPRRGGSNEYTQSLF